MQGRPSILVKVAFAATLLVSPAASAGPPEAPRFGAEAGAQRASSLLRKGDEDAAAGRLDDAYAAYREAWREHHGHQEAARLGALELERGEAAAAATHLGFAARAFPPGGSAEELELIRRRLDEARRVAGELRVRASSPLAEVWVDGARAGFASEEALFLAPGTRAVEVRAPGCITERRQLEIAPGSLQELSVTLARLRPERPGVDEPAPRAPQRGPGKSHSFIIGGLASATMLGLLGASLISQGEEELRGIGTGAVIAAGALGAGTLLYALWPSSEAAPPSPARVRVLPGAGATGAGVSVVGCF